MFELNQLELDSEVWKKVPGTENMYVSNMARVKKVLKTKERYLQPYFRKRKPPYFIKVNGKEIKLAVLVWRVFMGNYDSGIYGITHRVLITDDRLINLYMASKSEIGSKTGGNTKKVKGIYKCDKTKRVLYEYYRNSRDAAKANYCSYQTILVSCNGKTKKNCTGFDFLWAPKVENYIPRKGEDKKFWVWFYDLEVKE